MSPVLELNQLRCFLAVAEELHFGRAARRLNMTQPALSRQIQVLERVLGVALFDRANRSVRVTVAGCGLLPDAKRICRAAEQAAAMVKRRAAGEIGTLSLGFTAASGYDYLPRFIKHVRAIVPGVGLALHEMVSSDQIAAVRAGEIDLALMREPFDRHEFQSHCVVAEPLIVAVHEGHEAAGRDSLDFGDLADQPMILHSPGGARYFYDLTMAQFQAVGREPKVAHFVGQIHSMLSLVGAGLGLALVPQAARALHIEGVRYLPLRTQKALAVELHAVWRPDNDNPVVARIMADRAALQL